MLPGEEWINATATPLSEAKLRKRGNGMAGWVLMGLLLVMTTAAVAFDLGVAQAASVVAKALFLVVPVVFMVSLVIGLRSRSRVSR